MARQDLVRGEFNRRAFLGRAAATAAAVGTPGLLTACGNDDDRGTPSSGETTGTLRVAYYEFIDNVAPWLDDLKNEFEEANPGVTVEYLPQAADITAVDALVRKLSLEAREGEATYDLLLGTTGFVDVGALAKAGAVLNLDELLPDSYLDRLIGSAREGVIATDGSTYCMPFWTDVVGLMSRPDMLAEYGVDAPTTWDELPRFAEQLAGELPNDTYAYGADWAFIHRLFYPILVTLTDEPIADNGTINVGSPEGLQALELIKQVQPFMPPNAGDTSSRSDEAFQAGKLAMATYWQAKYQRSLESGFEEDQLEFGPNLEGSHPSTFFWDVSAVVTTHSAMPEVAVKFVTDGLLGEFGMTQSAEVSGRACPVTDLTDTVELPPWLEPAYNQLETGVMLPCNDAFVSVEQPTYLEEVGRMILEDVSPADTQKTLADAFSAYEY